MRSRLIASLATIALVLAACSSAATPAPTIAPSRARRELGRFRRPRRRT